MQELSIVETIEGKQLKDYEKGMMEEALLYMEEAIFAYEQGSTLSSVQEAARISQKAARIFEELSLNPNVKFRKLHNDLFIEIPGFLTEVAVGLELQGLMVEDLLRLNDLI